MARTLRVPFGMKDGILYEPNQVPNGKNCGCFCPGCNTCLIARQGANTPHFAHAPSEDCIHGLETIIHLAAKQLIERRMELSLPRVHLYIPHFNPVINRIFHEAQLVKLEQVFLEKSINDMRPDIVAIESGDEILIEIAVTHFVDETKRKKIRRRGSRAIEIDASTLRESLNFSSLETLLFGKPQKTTWLYHPEIESAYQECSVIEETNRKQDNLAKKAAMREKEAADEDAKRERKKDLVRYKILPPAAKLAKNMKSVGINEALVSKLTSFVP